jgi:hypothetical protein
MFEECTVDHGTPRDSESLTWVFHEWTVLGELAQWMYRVENSRHNRRDPMAIHAR